MNIKNGIEDFKKEKNIKIYKKIKKATKKI